MLHYLSSTGTSIPRHGKGSGGINEEHALPKESDQRMRQLAISQRSPEIHLSPSKDQQVDVGVARSGFVRFAHTLSFLSLPLPCLATPDMGHHGPVA